MKPKAIIIIELKSYLVKSVNSKVKQTLKEQAAVTVFQSTQRGLVYMMQRLVKKVKQLEMTAQKNPVPQVQHDKQQLRRNQANSILPSRFSIVCKSPLCPARELC